jgi:peptidyl-prolyl cis-trans isomerase B (cyclophilin B)
MHRTTRVWISAAVLVVLLGALYALNSVSTRPKAPPDVQLEGRLAKPAPEAPPSNVADAVDTTKPAEAGSAAAGDAKAAPLTEATAAADEKALLAKAKGSVVKLDTDKGTLYLDLYDAKVPIAAGNFLELVGRKFYDGLTFHRVIADFMIQGGDPKGDGTGGPGFTIPDEADKGLKHVRGSLAMAKTSAPDSGGCQFYICHSPQPSLDGSYTVFGECIKGMDAVDSIAIGDHIKKAVILKKSALADADVAKALKARVSDGG